MAPNSRARLLLHDPPTSPTDGAVQVVMKGLKVRVTLTGKGDAMLGRGR